MNLNLATTQKNEKIKNIQIKNTDTMILSILMALRIGDIINIMNTVTNKKTNKAIATKRTEGKTIKTSQCQRE